MVYNYTTPRGPVSAMFTSPGPAYGLPGLVGQRSHDPRSIHNRGPAYCFGLKHGRFRDECSPGPVYLPQHKIYRDGKDGTPHYSVSVRRPMTAGMVTPGPGAYAPEKNRGSSAHHRAPAYTMRVRTAGPRRDKTPGPNQYTPDRMLGETVRSGKPRAPGYTMVGKSQIGSFCQDLSKTPGPGAYGTPKPDIYKTRSAGYSMTGRNTMPGDNTQKPGPGAHSPERHLTATKRRVPKFSFGIRHSQYIAPLINDPVT